MTAVLSDDGFSLIELMIVMVIIGLMTGAAVVLVPEQTPPLIESARKVASTMTALKRQSVMTGRVYAIDARAGTLDARLQTQSGWVSAKEIISTANMFLQDAQISLSGIQVPKGKPSDDFLPQIWFLPTGEFQPFQMAANSDGGLITINATMGQAIKVTFDEK